MARDDDTHRSYAQDRVEPALKVAARRDTHPNYRQDKVEAVMLEVAAERHPSRFTEEELVGEIVSKPDDEREVETARRAIGGLREFGLARSGNGNAVELTPTALRAVALLCR